MARFACGVAALLLIGGCRSVDLSPSDEDPPSGTVRVHGTMAVGDAGQDDGGPITGDPSVTIDAPADGSTFVRDVLDAGEWAALVTFSVTAMNVASVSIVVDDEFDLGETDASGTLDVLFYGDGPHLVAAIGYDAGGTEVARDEISITIEAPADASCHAMLDTLGLDWEIESATRGIADPVRVQPVINGVTFRNSSGTAASLLMDCELGVRLYRLTEVLARHDIDEVTHLGIYNYRCIGGGDPDSGTCTPSMHAYARAIDLHAFGAAGSDVVYSTETDFVITSSSTCPIESFNDEDRVLKEIACELYSERIFEIILTPNYNADHRNHFHVDLTEGSMFLGEGVGGVDPGIPGLGE